ncbi:MAG: ATP-binding protein [Leptospiraceae bacterium]|nr:ATP-binding protein [Leptospiraceae bacterium]
MAEKQNQCTICKGLGVTFQPVQKRGQPRMVTLCSCKSLFCETCPGDKEPPYYFFDETDRQSKPCVCRDSRIRLDQIASLFKKSNIPWKFRCRPMSDFKMNSNDATEAEYLVTALDNARLFMEQFSENYQGPSRGLYIFGPPGVGKSFLGSLILNELILHKQIDAYFMKITRDFFNRLRATFNPETTGYGQGDNYFNDLANKKVLMIDDFGVQSDTDWEQRTLYDLIDMRYEYERPTILTSNKAPEEYKEFFNGRIYSRLKEMSIFQPIIATDFRDKLKP